MSNNPVFHDFVLLLKEPIVSTYDHQQSNVSSTDFAAIYGNQKNPFCAIILLDNVISPLPYEEKKFPSPATFLQSLIEFKASRKKEVYFV